MAYYIETRTSPCSTAQFNGLTLLPHLHTQLEMIYLDEVINCPVVQVVNYTLFSDRLQLPVDTYVPGYGWGIMYGDIVE